MQSFDYLINTVFIFCPSWFKKRHDVREPRHCNHRDNAPADSKTFQYLFCEFTVLIILHSPHNRYHYFTLSTSSSHELKMWIVSESGYYLVRKKKNPARMRN